MEERQVEDTRLRKQNQKFTPQVSFQRDEFRFGSLSEIISLVLFQVRDFFQIWFLLVVGCELFSVLGLLMASNLKMLPVIIFYDDIMHLEVSSWWRFFCVHHILTTFLRWIIISFYYSVIWNKQWFVLYDNGGLAVNKLDGLDNHDDESNDDDVVIVIVSDQ